MNHFDNLRVGVAVLATAGMAGCASGGRPTAETSPGTPSTVAAPTPTAATATGPGADGSLTDVPWPQVGPGWTLAQWSPEQNAGATLYLVDPAADRYAITTLERGTDVELVDWSGDGSHALFAPAAVTPSSAISVDLRTGAQSAVALSGYPRYTRPDGLALLVSTEFNGKKPGTLKRIDLQGNPQLAYPTEDLGGAGPFSGEYAASPDGTQLVLGTANLGNELVPRTDNSLVVLGNDGTVIRRLAAPMPEAVCKPVKWWTPQTLLAQCVAEKGSANQLWEVPLDGGAPTALTAVNSGQGDDPAFKGDLGDVDAWKLPSGVFLQSLGAGCDRFLSRLTSDGHTTRVQVPDVAAGAVVTGATNGRLVLRDQKNCRGTTSLVSFDPATNTSTVLLGPPVNGGSVSQSMLYRSADS
ncbi:hypothetical protein [Mycobacterium sp. DL592]|uniref:hypothetical protein n=1 Tax=Mycobacterium sp. DL592 TaxID=2675524 RepID=UPI001FB898D6|nr:hypothetical protein [Mycobacterium sp. DL592]